MPTSAAWTPTRWPTRLAPKIRADGKLDSFLEDRYASYDSDYGKEIEKGKIGFRELEKLVLKKLGEPKPQKRQAGVSRKPAQHLPAR